jgi:hypothetical protein
MKIHANMFAKDPSTAQGYMQYTNKPITNPTPVICPELLGPYSTGPQHFPPSPVPSSDCGPFLCQKDVDPSLPQMLVHHGYRCDFVDDFHSG